MLVPAIIISAVSACVYPFLKWNHKNTETPDCAPYNLMNDTEKEDNKKITISGTITYKIEEDKPLTPSQKMRRNISKRV